MPQKNVKKNLVPAPGYAGLVKKISQELSQLDFFIKRRTVEAYWRVGRYIHEHILENKERAYYGAYVLRLLAEEVDRDKSILARALRFYRTYPIVARGQQFNWSQYRKLITIKDKDERQRLEKRIIEKGWDARKLQEYLKFKKIKLAVSGGEEKAVERLSFTRGKPLTYGVLRSDESDSGFLLDLGFRVRKDFPQARGLKLKDADCVQIEPKSGSFIKASVAREEMFTYRAAVEKVVDGDTLTVLIHLGLGWFIEQKLRLRGIDCPEIDTPEGVKAKRFVESQLKGLGFIVVKTHKDRSDKYDRYLSDVFYAKAKTDPLSAVVERGEFLNQRLLDEGLAWPVK